MTEEQNYKNERFVTLVVCIAIFACVLVVTLGASLTCAYIFKGF
ncbi:hypothetical protein [Helicobacter cetorum]|nr:hypothetical protein [Helicobacter cetorum]